MPNGRKSDILSANSGAAVYDSLIASLTHIHTDNRYQQDHQQFLSIISTKPEYRDITQEIAELTAEEQQLIKRQIQERNELPAISDSTPIQISATLAAAAPTASSPKSSRTSPRKINYEKRDKRNRLIGAYGERIVLKYEYAKLMESEQYDLAARVERCSETDDSLGYDVLSFHPDGTEKHIEVKTISGKSAKVRFFISANELDKVRTDAHHSVYLVFQYRTTTPEILELHDLAAMIDTNKAILNPMNYEVVLHADF